MCTVKEMEMNNYLLGLHRWQTCIDFDEYESITTPHVSDSGTVPVKKFAAIGVTSWAGWSKKKWRWRARLLALSLVELTSREISPICPTHLQQRPTTTLSHLNLITSNNEHQLFPSALVETHGRKTMREIQGPLWTLWAGNDDEIDVAAAALGIISCWWCDRGLAAVD